MKILFFFFLTLCRLTAPKIPEGEKVDFDVSIPETDCICLSVPEPYTPPVLDTAEDKVMDKSMDALPSLFSERLLSAPWNSLDTFVANVTKLNC